jgi:hypothetical protein
MALGPAVLTLVLLGVLACPPASAAGAGLTLAGRPVAPRETNFAGDRHESPGHRVVVQMNHDTRADAALDLALVDEAFRVTRSRHPREPYFDLAALPLVFIADAKMRRFLEAPQRLLFGRMDVEVKRQQDVYPSPNAVFITDATLGDPPRLRRALERALGFYFDGDFYRAVGGLDQARPRPAD